MPVELMLRAEGDNQTTTVQLDSSSEDFDFESSGQPIEVVVDPNNKILRMSDDFESIHHRAPRYRVDEGWHLRRSATAV